jgi:hypothetical protein
MKLPRNAVSWPDILRAVQDEKARSSVSNVLRDAELTPDQFGSNRKARELVADQLTRVEDELEPRRGKRAAAERLAIRDVRRRLELELWP